MRKACVEASTILETLGDLQNKFSMKLNNFEFSLILRTFYTVYLAQNRTYTQRRIKPNFKHTINNRLKSTYK